VAGLVRKPGGHAAPAGQAVRSDPLRVQPTLGAFPQPQIVSLLEAQGIQSPLIKIHTGWLLIKHVDEIFNFIPVPGVAASSLVPDAPTPTAARSMGG